MTTQELYNKVKKGEISKEQFLFEVKRDPRFISIIHISNNFDDTVSILKNKGMISESEEASAVKHFNIIGIMREGLEKLNQPLNEAAKATSKKQKLKGGKGDKTTPDDVNYYEFQKGWRHELEHTDDVDKAKEIALDHLSEDPIYYTRLQMVEYQANKKKRTDLPIEVTKKEVKDPNNQMEKVKKITNSNTGKVETHKVEEYKKNVGNKKEKPKSIKTKVMKGGPGNMVKKALKEFLETFSDKKKLNEGLDPSAYNGIWEKNGATAYDVIIRVPGGGSFMKSFKIKNKKDFVEVADNFSTTAIRPTEKGGKIEDPEEAKKAAARAEKAPDYTPGGVDKAIEDHKKSKSKLPPIQTGPLSKRQKKNLKAREKKVAQALQRPEYPIHTIELVNGTKINWPIDPMDAKILSAHKKAIKSVTKAEPNTPKDELRSFTGKIVYSDEIGGLGKNTLDAEVKDISPRILVSLLKRAKDVSSIKVKPKEKNKIFITRDPSKEAEAEKQKEREIQRQKKAEEDLPYFREIDKQRATRPFILQTYGQYQLVTRTGVPIKAVKTKQEADRLVNMASGTGLTAVPSGLLYVQLQNKGLRPAKILKKLEPLSGPESEESPKETSENNKLNEFKEIIRKIFYKKLDEYNVMMAPQGPAVKKKELNRLLQGYQWSTPEDDYQKLNKQENLHKIMTLINALGKVGQDLYKEYEPEGGDQGTQIPVGVSENVETEDISDTKTLIAGDTIYYQGSAYEVKATDEVGNIDAIDPKTKKAIKINTQQVKDYGLKKVKQSK